MVDVNNGNNGSGDSQNCGGNNGEGHVMDMDPKRGDGDVSSNNNGLGSQM
jgi:hypothetical protein